jgi:hypothetical protein
MYLQILVHVQYVLEFDAPSSFNCLFSPNVHFIKFLGSKNYSFLYKRRLFMAWREYLAK